MKRLEEVISSLQQELQKIQQCRAKECVSWPWVCTKVMRLLSEYPSGITRAILLSELHQALQANSWRTRLAFQRGGRSSHKRVEIASVLDSKSVGYIDVLNVTVTRCYDIPGTTTKLVYLTDSGGLNSSRGIEMYLHKKFYDKLEDLMSCPMRMTCNRFVPTLGVPNSSSLRLLPSEHVIILLPSESTCSLENRFIPIYSVEQSTILEPCYIHNVAAEVAKIETEEVVHSSEGNSFRRLVVQLKGAGSSLIPLVLWDSYISFIRLFQEGDVLYLEKPYAKPNSDGSFCLEYGPGTVIYMRPFQPRQEIVSTQQSHELISVPVVKTLDGKLDYSSYPYRIHIEEIVPDLVNVTLMSLCTRISKIEAFNSQGSGYSSERFTLELANSLSSISVVVDDPTHKVFRTLHTNQCLVLEGLSSCVGDDGGKLVLCNIGSGARIYNASCLPGRLLTPYVCNHKTLAEARDGDDVEFTAVATLLSWDNISSPIQLCHGLCGRSSRKAGKTLVCDHCSIAEPLSGLHGAVTDVSRNIDGPAFMGVANTCSRWLWMFNLVSVFGDKSGDTLQMTFTSTAAASLLGCLPDYFANLSSDERVDSLECVIGKDLLLCVTKVLGGYQVNLACRKP